MTNARQLETELFRYACRQDFWTFANYGFGIKNYIRDHPEDNWLSEPVHKRLCDWFGEHVHAWLKSRRGAVRRKKLMIVWPRNFGKTTLITKAGNLWLHLQNPDLATAIDSVTFTKATDFQDAIRDVLDGTNPYAWFRTLYGNWVGSTKWRTGALTHTQRRAAKTEPSFRATSIETGLTGEHPDVVFIDDPVTREKLRDSDTWLRTVDDGIAALIPVIPPTGMVVAIATRYADSDWLGNLMREEGVRSISGHKSRDPDFLITPDGQWDLYLLRARTDLGLPVLPGQWSDQALRDYENKEPIEYAAQMMNEPGEGQHMPLTWAQIETMFCSPRDVPGVMRHSMHLDMAFKDRMRVGLGDYSVIEEWGHDRHGHAWYLDGEQSNKWTSDDFRDKFVAKLTRMLADKHRPFVITYDEEIGGLRGTFKKFLESACHEAGIILPPTMAIKRNRKKDTRLRDAAMYWADGRVHLVRTAGCVRELAGQMARIGVSRRRDLADAAADVFADGVYTPEPKATVVGNYRPHRPWDDEILRPLNKISIDAGRRAYDAMRDAEIHERRDPWAN